MSHILALHALMVHLRTQTQGHPCYDPVKDLVVPSYKHPHHYHSSPLLGHRPVERNILLFFRGDVGKHRMPIYRCTIPLLVVLHCCR